VPITLSVTTRAPLTIVLVIALAFGGWQLLARQADRASTSAGDSADALVETVSGAYFTGAQVSLESQRRATGSYAGTPLQPPVTLVRGDATSYCIQLDRPPQVRHLAGPGGSPAAGPCS
jgi:hypothetical protein